ncbi:MAG: (2Fe-2S) ferredoxin domain-containing protein [Desulfobacterales bacterium]|nr:(2Fe-2S) ferredoxin domain-containing protein [Desulfobacterales bacterium]
MAKLTINDLKKIKEDVSKATSVRNMEETSVVTVHFGTCGIAAGARDVMNTLMNEITEADVHDVKVLSGGCLGMCSSEPNVTVQIKQDEPIIYQNIDGNKIRQIFKRHILKGEVQTEFALAKK